MKEKKITLDLWHQFTPEELETKGQELAAANIKYGEVEMANKIETKKLADNLAAIDANCYTLSRQVRERGLNVPVDCLVTFHKPKVGRKTIIRLDTGEQVREEVMTPTECQEHLFPPKDVAEAVIGHIAENAEQIGQELSTEQTKVTVTVPSRRVRRARA